MIEVRYDRGSYLPGCDLWLDPRGTRPFAFVSHAHSDHTGHHQRTILTEATARMIRARLGSGGKFQHVLRFWERREFGTFHATLIPAGHVLGSAQIFIENSEGTLLYTGDFKLRSSLASEKAESVHAETLIMETTYGRPRYKFPPREKTVRRILDFCRQALEEDQTPVLLGYSLGKAQEVLAALTGAGLPVMLHGSVWQMTRLYEELGAVFPSYVKFEPGLVAGHVLLCPPATARSSMIESLKAKRVAMITGWGMDQSAKFRYRCDEVFPLSDHADYDELLEMVERVNPSRVLTLHGYASEFAQDLRRRGLESWALTGGNQMELPI